jgi:excisionase family DNA binding protein
VKTQSDSDRLLNVRDAATMLGLKSSTLYQWAYERRIAHVKIGGALRFRLSAIEKLIAQSERPALRVPIAREGA